MIKKIKIGYRHYDLEFHAASHELEPGYVGLHQTMKQKILIAEGITPVKQANTLLHEILHAVCTEYEIFEDQEAEERTVSCLANGLSQFIQDNPKTLKWITDNLNNTDSLDKRFKEKK